MVEKLGPISWKFEEIIEKINENVYLRLQDRLINAHLLSVLEILWDKEDYVGLRGRNQKRGEKKAKCWGQR